MWLNQTLNGLVNLHRPTSDVVPLTTKRVNVGSSPFGRSSETVDLTAVPAGILHRKHSTRRAEHHGLSCLTISRYPTASVKLSSLGVSVILAILRPAIMSATFHGGMHSMSRIPDQTWPMRQWLMSGGPYSALRWLATSPRAKSLRVFSLLCPGSVWLWPSG